MDPATWPSFEGFVAARQRALLRFAMVLTGDSHQAEDLCADVLARAYDRWGRIGRLDQPEAYVRRMLVNEHVSWRRRAGRRLALERLESADRRVVADPADPHAQRQELVQHLQRLPPKQRAVIVLRFYEGLRDDEIATVLGCRPGTVRSHLSRGLRTLRVDLTPAGAVDAAAAAGRPTISEIP